MAVDPASAVVRVVGPDGTAGTGFVVAPDLLATCAHVVEFAGAGPGGAVEVSFQLTKDRRLATVEPSSWRPSTAEDVAILRLADPLPEGVEELLLGPSAGALDHPFRSFGFPRGKPTEGLGGQGTISRTVNDESGYPVLQLSGASEVTVGFSGGPIYDTLARRVVGMVTSVLLRDEQGRGVETAFGTPAETLLEVCPELTVSEIPPYRGLATFTEEDAEFFFGRDDIRGRLLDRLRWAPQFLAILGPSGTGKSSLVRAGLLPALRDGALPGSEAWAAILTRPAELAELDRRLPGALTDLPDALAAWLERHPRQSRVALVVDQFEELFIDTSEQTRATFLDGLAVVAAAATPAYIILTMRDEFYSRFIREAPRLTRPLEAGLVNVPPTLTRRECEQIITEPARLLGLHFEEGLAGRILDDMIAASAVATGAAADAGPGEAAVSPLHATAETGVIRSTMLPLLEFALDELWAARRDGVLHNEAYQKIGGVVGGLARWANKTIAELGPDDRALAQRVLTGLVHLGNERDGIPDTRWRRAIASLCRDPGEAPQVTAVVHRLADARLVVTGYDPKIQEETVELTHDVLVREWVELVRWVRQDREFLTWLHELEQARGEWERSGTQGSRDDGRLLRGRSLDRARNFLAERRSDLTASQREFIDASVEDWERQQRELRVALEEAQRQRAIAESERVAATLREQAARVRLLLTVSPTTALLHAVATIGRNLAELPEELLAPVQTSLHAAVLAARERAVCQGHTAPVTSTTFSPDGQTVISASADRTLRAWDLDGGPLGSPWAGHEDAVNAAAFSPDGRLVVSAGADGQLRLWDPDGNPLGGPWEGHEDAVTAVAFSPDGHLVVSAGADGQLRLWDPDGNPLGEPLAGHSGAVTAVAFNSTGRGLVSGDELGLLLSSVNVLGTRRTTPLAQHGAAVTGIALGQTNGDDTVLSSGADGRVRLWTPRGREVEPALVGEGGPLLAIAHSRNGRMVAGGSTDGTVRLWHRDERLTGAVLRGHTSDVNRIVVAGGGSRIVSGSADHTLRAWTRRGRPLGDSWHGHDGFVFDVAADPHGERVVSASADQTLRLWQQDGKQVGAPFGGHEGAARAVAVSPDGTSIASGGLDRVVRLWDLTGKQIRAPMPGHEAEVLAVAFSPEDGRLLASAGADRMLRLWELPTGTLRSPFSGHEDEIRAVAFRPDGHAVVTASLDRTLRLWSIDGQLLAPPFQGHSDGVHAVAFSPDGQLIVSGSADGSLRLWNLRGDPVSEPIEGHEGSVWAVTMHPDGQTCYSGGEDGTVRVWTVGWRAWLALAAERLRQHPALTDSDSELAATVRAILDEQPWSKPGAADGA